MTAAKYEDEKTPPIKSADDKVVITCHTGAVCYAGRLRDAPYAGRDAMGWLTRNFHTSDYTAKGGWGRPMRGVLRIGNEGTEWKGWTVMAA